MDVLPSSTTPGSFHALVNDVNGAPWSPAAVAFANHATLLLEMIQ